MGKRVNMERNKIQENKAMRELTQDTELMSYSDHMKRISVILFTGTELKKIIDKELQ